MLRRAVGNAGAGRATIFGYRVDNPRPLRRCRTGRVGASAVDCGKTRTACQRQGCRRAIFSIPTTLSTSLSGIAPVETRRAGDHHCQRSISESEPPRRGTFRPRIRMARHRHHRLSDGGFGFRRGHTETTGSENCGNRRSRIPTRLHLGGAIGRTCSPLLCTDYGQYLETSCR